MTENQFLPNLKRVREATAAWPFSLGATVILVLMVASSCWVLFRPSAAKGDIEFWLFARTHYRMYQPVMQRWEQQGGPEVRLSLLSAEALTRRFVASVHAGTPVADLVEAERVLASQVFSGPLDSIGLVDLTQRIQEQNLDEIINEPSFSPWTVNGRIFGLPHDVHPVLLCYRRDLVEQAGIDIESLQTWGEFAEVMQKMVVDLDGDGTADRYPLSLSVNSVDAIEALLLQAGGGLYDQSGLPDLATPVNARVLATIATWLTGPRRIAGEAPEFSASGNRLRLQGYVVCSLMPDWLTKVWETDTPQLGGKLGLMPLPAWQSGGRRTSVWGGTMAGIPRNADDPDAAWAIAKELYFDEGLARELYEQAGIITPIKKFWSRSWFDEPRAFFGGQPVGRLYVEAAPDVPRRVSSPLDALARAGLQQTALRLVRHADDKGEYGISELETVAMALLSEVDERLNAHLKRSVFLQERAN